MIPISDTPFIHPASAKWYWLKWNDQELQGATVSSATWTTDGRLTVQDQAINGQLAGVKVSVADGVSEGEYSELELEIVTSTGETLHEQMVIKIDRRGH